MTRRPAMCRLTLHHRWRIESTDDGGRFRRCSRCGKFDRDDDRGHWAGSAATM